MEATGRTESEDEFLDDAVKAVHSIQFAASVLKVVAIFTAVGWTVGTVLYGWSLWEQTERLAAYEGGDVITGITADDELLDRLRVVLGSTLASTWGYALVAVGALIGWMYAETRKASVFLDAMDEVEELRVRTNEGRSDEES